MLHGPAPCWIVHFNRSGIPAQPKISRFAALARPGGEGNEVGRRHGIAVAVTRIVDVLPGLNQEPAVRVVLAAMLVIARRAVEFDDVVDLLEGQVEPGREPGHQLTGLLGAPRAGLQPVMNG